MIEHVETPHKLVALTFDDGPNPVYTLNVLEILEKVSGKATVFYDRKPDGEASGSCKGGQSTRT